MDAGNKNIVAVIGFSTAPSPLEPAWPSTHRALLPIAGKPLIVHLIEQLARGGIRHLRIAGSIQQDAARHRLGDGSEWGVRIRYSDLHDADLRLQTLLEHEHCLYLCGDNLHVADFSELRADAGIGIDDPAARSERSVLWRLEPGGPAGYSIAAATSGKPYVREPLLTVQSYHTCNLMAARRDDNALVVPGRALKPGVFVDWDTWLAPDVILGEDITIGKHCQLDRRVRLDSRCVLGNGVVIGRNSRLRNVSVLPNTYVGAGVRLQDAVVTPLGLFDLDGKFLQRGDGATFGRVRGNAERYTGLPSEKFSVMEKSRRRRRDTKADFAAKSNLTNKRAS